MRIAVLQIPTLSNKKALISMTIYSHSVYWIHLPNQTDITVDGYVGVSNNPKRRLLQHMTDSKIQNPFFSRVLKKHAQDIVQTIIFQGTEEGCYSLEESMRPFKNIGWNANKGGNSPPSKKGWIPSDSTREKWSLAFKGRIMDSSWKENLSISKIGEKNGMFGKKSPCLADKKISIIKTKNEHRLQSLIELFKLSAEGCSIRNISKITGYSTATIIAIRKDPSLHFKAFPILEQFKTS